MRKKLKRISAAELVQLQSRLTELATDTKAWQKEFSSPTSWMNQVVCQRTEGGKFRKMPLKEALVHGHGRETFKEVQE